MMPPRDPNYHRDNPDNTEDEEGQELEGAVASNDPDFWGNNTVPAPGPHSDKPHNDQSPDGEEG